MFGLTGHFYEYLVTRNHVRVYNVDSKSTYNITRNEFAAMLRNGRNVKHTSIVKW